jgi:hypothetical protein
MCYLCFRLGAAMKRRISQGLHPELREDKHANDYLWIEGSVKAHRYDVARRKIDLFLVSAMGIMEVIGLLRYRDFRSAGCNLSIGNRTQINSGQYRDMHSVRLSGHFLGLCDPGAGNEIDAAKTGQNRVDSNLRIFCRAIADSSPSALAVRHACRTYLRAYESWNFCECRTSDVLLSSFCRRSRLSVMDPNAVTRRISVPALFPETRSGYENPSSV